MVAQSVLIPRHFHRIWLGGDMPEEFQRYGESFRRLHPQWEMTLWTEENLFVLKNQTAFDQATTYAQKADILRYEILERYGGVYIDTDFECQKPLDGLLEGVTAFSATEDTQWISIGIMGAVPHHPLFSAVVDELPRSLAALPDAPVNEQTGPLFFTRVAMGRRMKKMDGDFVVFPPSHFYPYRIGEEYKKAAGFPGAYAVHHWAGSWVQKTGPRAGTTATRLAHGAQGAGGDNGQLRVLLGFDPENPSSGLSILMAFQKLFGPQDPIELGVYAYAEPSLPLLECIQQLLAALVGDPQQMAGLSLLSRADLTEIGYHAAYFPGGDTLEDARGVADVLLSLSALRSRLDFGVEGRGILPLPACPARKDILVRAARRPEPVASPMPSAVENRVEASAKSASSAGPLFGTGIGDGRVLVRTLGGAPLLCHSHDLSLTPELLLNGQYDRPLSRFLETRLAKGHVAFDIGANIGLFTLQMAQLVGSTGHVVAFEALPNNYQLVLDNLGMNYQSEHCTVLPLAAWCEKTTLRFSAPARFLGNGSATMNPVDYLRRYPGDTLSEIAVEAVMAGEQMTRFPRVQLCKIDVEGAELQVLLGMKREIESGKVRCIVFECLRSLLGADFAPLMSLLKTWTENHNMRLYSLDPDGNIVDLPLGVLERVGNFTQVVLERAN